VGAVDECTEKMEKQEGQREQRFGFYKTITALFNFMQQIF
jgi:hypothetical protein